jgi:hypothetical protein
LFRRIVLQTPTVAGIFRLKIVQKSFGVMMGFTVAPNARLGSLAETGTMSVGARKLGRRFPLGGQEFLPIPMDLDETISRRIIGVVEMVRMRNMRLRRK